MVIALGTWQKQARKSLLQFLENCFAKETSLAYKSL